jgi:dienelactone hydrolase
MKKNLVLLYFLITLQIIPTYAQIQDSSSWSISVLRARQFINHMANGRFVEATAHFDKTMNEVSPPVKLEETWIAINKQLGTFQSQIRHREAEYVPYHFVYVTCQFDQTKMDLKVVFNRQNQIAGFFLESPQATQSYSIPTYVDTSNFIEKILTFGKASWKLPATLSIPKGYGPFYGVVLVHGSGPQDRDETIGPNKVFRDLAWGLSTEGIAVLRYEKRTKQHSSQLKSVISKFTVYEETIHDAIEAVEFLQQHPSIKEDKIFVLGHSLGGMLIPRISKGNAQIAGFVIMAGSTRPLEDMIIEQVQYIQSLSGKPTKEDKKRFEELQAQANRIKSLTPADSVSSEILMGAPPSYWLDLKDYQPHQEARFLSQPLLIMQGGRDYQVTMEDYNNWKKSLNNRQDVTFKYYPSLNHLFIAGKGKSTPGEYALPGHVLPAVIQDMIQWIRNH